MIYRPWCSAEHYGIRDNGDRRATRTVDFRSLLAGGDGHDLKNRVEQLAYSRVFVASSGRRRTWATWILGMVAGTCVGYLIMLGLSLVGGPITPQQLLPLTDIPNAQAGEAVDPPETGSVPTAPPDDGTSASPVVPWAPGVAPTTVPLPTPTSTLLGAVPTLLPSPR